MQRASSCWSFGAQHPHLNFDHGYNRRFIGSTPGNKIQDSREILECIWCNRLSPISDRHNPVAVGFVTQVYADPPAQAWHELSGPRGEPPRFLHFTCRVSCMASKGRVGRGVHEAGAGEWSRSRLRERHGTEERGGLVRGTDEGLAQHRVSSL